MNSHSLDSYKDEHVIKPAQEELGSEEVQSDDLCILRGSM